MVKPLIQKMDCWHQKSLKSWWAYFFRWLQSLFTSCTIQNDHKTGQNGLKWSKFPKFWLKQWIVDMVISLKFHQQLKKNVFLMFFINFYITLHTAKMVRKRSKLSKMTHKWSKPPKHVKKLISNTEYEFKFEKIVVKILFQWFPSIFDS